MFKLAAVKRVWWPVVVEIPLDDGRTRKEEFDVELEILGQAEHEELVLATGRLLNRVLTGWRRVKNEDGTDDLPFTEENKAALLNIPYVLKALSKAYVDASLGMRAARKN